jgi:hypothetical protein
MTSSCAVDWSRSRADCASSGSVVTASHSGGSLFASRVPRSALKLCRPHRPPAAYIACLRAPRRTQSSA